MIRKVNQSMYAKVFKELLDGPMTAHDAVETCGIHIVTAQSLFRELRNHDVVHVTAWEPDSLGRDATPVYRLGEGKNKGRSKMSQAQRQQRHREKKQAQGLVNAVSL